MIKKETIIRDTSHKHDLFEEGKEVTYKLEETIVEPANFRSIKYMEGCIEEVNRALVIFGYIGGSVDCCYKVIDFEE